jgi:hypothetical protein
LPEPESGDLSDGVEACDYYYLLWVSPPELLWYKYSAISLNRPIEFKIY